MSAETINCEFATFVDEMFNWAEETFMAYTKKCITEFPSKPSTWNAHTLNAEAKMMTYLNGTLSEDMQLLVYSNKTNSGIVCLPSERPTPQVIICIATILNHINPGGAHIKRELSNYFRYPKEAETPAEAFAEKARWKGHMLIQ